MQARAHIGIDLASAEKMIDRGVEPAPFGCRAARTDRRQVGVDRRGETGLLLTRNDPRIIDIGQELALRNGRQPSDHEYQMMLGVRPFEQRRLVDIGLTCRTYVPFGPAWYDYVSARLAARPRMLWNYARAILDKR